ncbi:AAA family ATPase [Salirhabdus sp. Marseille-P4669]|uniref:AAA family ATPase n=1 Tax=Salirhabdus sp. Marseille-P4669 TaxID=2042310 RepID=UPI000C79FCA4|nr:AAA family ATPase [Salirhabdus sp. Marseille-P4669]
MRLVLLFGPQAVGKMTVGQELAKMTGLKLFHNHMTIDLVLNFFEYGTPPFKRLVNSFRNEILTEVANSDLPGVIFTYVWAFDMKEDWESVDRITNIFEAKGNDVYYVELEADVEERLKRNVTTNRLENKPTKRNIEMSEKDLLTTYQSHRLNSNENEINRKNYLKINNTKRSAIDVAKEIKDRFQLP